MDVLLSESDWESSSESGSSDDQEETEYFYGGQASSILSSLEETIDKIDEFLSFERGFMFGDAVSSVTDPSGQLGKVFGIELLVNLENSRGKLLKDVNSTRILRIRSISVGDYVVYGPWVGRVDKIIDCVTVVFDDGTRCQITAFDQDKLLPVSPSLFEDSQYPYYPGQRVRVCPSTVSKSTRWLCGTWKDNKDEGTVCSVEAGLVYVDWLASALVGCDSNFPPPSRLQKTKDLTLLSCFPHAHWQLGDWCMLPTDGNKAVMEKSFLHECAHEHMEDKKMERAFNGRSIGMNDGEIFVIVKTKIKVDVLWQDGSRSLGLDSQTLISASAVSAHEFWPDQFVMEKSIADDPPMSGTRQWGVVQAVNAKERTVKVQWKDAFCGEVSDLDGKWTHETMSAYELVEHPDYSFCLGDIVFRLAYNKMVCHSERDQLPPEISVNEEEAQFSNLDKYLLCIGSVTGFKDGTVEVTWASGSTTKVAPCEIFRIDKLEGSTIETVAAEENAEESSQEPIEPEKQSHSQKEKAVSTSDAVEKSCRKHAWESSTSFLPRAAMKFFSNITASLFGSVGSTSLSATVSSFHFSEDEKEPIILHEKEALEKFDQLIVSNDATELEKCNEASLDQEVEEVPEQQELLFSNASEKSDRFKQFDIVTDCPDHHFLGSGKPPDITQMSRGWLKKVQQEWSILEKNLPETIYVRVFEERMDLLRAIIIGAPGTPYHDGLFFFDISLPPEYPQKPPLVHYISGGLRANPNLYESGKVCLSLLNTWTGTGTEVWNPERSTILQVLLSLQALVLNEKPYFNEAGYDSQVGKAEGEKNSVSYNENAYLVNCKSMLYLMRKPPKRFETLLDAHFRQGSQNILSACRSYMEGAPVGCGHGLGVEDDQRNQTGSSTGFKIMLAKLFPKLVEAFASKGIDCKRFIEPEN